MRTLFIHILSSLLFVGTLISCDGDETSNIGSSLITDQVSIHIDSTFTVTGHSVKMGPIRPKVVSQLLGKITIPDFGTLENSVVSQFLPSTELDTANYRPQDVDSILLYFRYARGNFIGDSVAAMGVKVFALNKQLPKNIDSDFDPKGYYDPSAPLGSKVYNTSSFGNDTLAKQSYRDITVKLPTQLGRDLFQKFVDNPSLYANGQIFANDVFPGLYIENNFGAGRMTLVSSTFMAMHLRREKWNEEEEKLDTISAVHQYYLVTPEVLNNNNIKLTLDPKITERVNQGQSLLVTPGGYEVEFDFPTRDVIATFRSHSNSLTALNGLTMSLPVDTLHNDYGVAAPPYVLMVLKKDRDAFFKDNKLPDNTSSFYATYNSTKGTYDFSLLRNYFAEMLDKEEITDEDCRFCLVPVQVNFEQGTGYGSTQSVISEVLPLLVSPCMAQVKFDEAKIKLTYSLQTQK